MTLFDHGCYDPLKLGIHAALLALAGVAAGYNAICWVRDRQRHHAVNAGVYTALVIWERRLCAGHRSCGSVRELGP